MEEDKVEETYNIVSDSIEASISIVKKKDAKLHTYVLTVPKLEPASKAFLDDIKNDLLKKVSISSQEALDITMVEKLKKRFTEMGREMLAQKMPHLSPKKIDLMCGKLVQEMLGLGDFEFMLKDDWLEEICINSSKEPVWVYHRKYGWIISNMFLPSEVQTWNYSSSIARNVGRQINTQHPLLDAYLPSGDRVNATLQPISTFGNTITIRKFARKPWTIVDYIKLNTISSEVAALLWLAIQYEMNMIVSGGTGAGKTSLLNVLCAFIPQNQRIVSIEQTREIVLPSYLQWVPLVVREATSEGKGEINMLDLMVNSLRMRPDRILVGEIRRAEEAQVLFEAMHTGHSVYATLHAETVSETIRRLTNPPINIPSVMMESLHLITAMYRDRRTKKRRIFEIGEILSSEEKEGIHAKVIYRWRAARDKLIQEEESTRFMGSIKTYVNMTDREIEQNLTEKKNILDWMVKKDINTVEKVGDIISKYYDDPSKVMKLVHGK